MPSRLEVKLFLTFFLIYSLFVHWTGWVDDADLFLTRSIVENATFYIDDFYNQTPHRSYYNGHYYSSQPQGLSFISVPIFALYKSIYTTLNFPVGKNYGIIESRIGNGAVANYIRLDNLTLISIIIIVIF